MMGLTEQDIDAAAEERGLSIGEDPAEQLKRYELREGEVELSVMGTEVEGERVVVKRKRTGKVVRQYVDSAGFVFAENYLSGPVKNPEAIPMPSAKEIDKINADRLRAGAEAALAAHLEAIERIEQLAQTSKTSISEKVEEKS